MTAPDILNQRWYACANDLIGGWAVMNVDKPPSQVDRLLHEIEVADFCLESTARHIVDLHNTTLDGAEQTGERIARVLRSVVAALGHNPDDPEVRAVLAKHVGAEVAR